MEMQGFPSLLNVFFLNKRRKTFINFVFRYHHNSTYTFENCRIRMKKKGVFFKLNNIYVTLQGKTMTWILTILTLSRYINI